MAFQHLIFRLWLCLLCLSFGLSPSYAQGLRDLTIIRDVEIESALREWATPLIKAAHLEEENIDIILVQSDQINAFVAGGANIFIYTGLIEKTENPGEIIGVMAHELGHIAGGHLINNTQALKRASYESILGMALGMGAAILTGNGQVASAIGVGAQHHAMSSYLSHSRTNESSADQAALRFLQDSHQSPEGLVTFFEKLEDQELLPASQQNEYVRTHPLTRNRITNISTKAHQSQFYNQEWPKHWNEQHTRMKAKLQAFINPKHISWNYNDRDKSFAANYARTIASYRLNNIDEALTGIDKLIAQEPQNPYLYELKGQMLVEFSRVEEALPALQKTVDLAPKVGLFRIALGHALIEASSRNQKSEYLKQAINHLKFAAKTEKRNTRVHRLLATAYGRIGEDNLAQIHLAEEALLQGNYRYAQRLAQQVTDNTADNDPARLHAQDILKYIAVAMREQ